MIFVGVFLWQPVVYGLELQTQELGVLHSSTELQQRLKVGHSNPTAADPCQLIALSAASL